MYEHEFTKSIDVSLYFSENGGERYLASLFGILSILHISMNAYQFEEFPFKCLSSFIINPSDHETYTNKDEYEITKSFDVYLFLFKMELHGLCRSLMDRLPINFSYAFFLFAGFNRIWLV